MLGIRCLCESHRVQSWSIREWMNTPETTWEQTSDGITSYRNKTPNSKLPSRMEQIFLMTQRRNKQVLVSMKLIFQWSPEVCPGGGGMASGNQCCGSGSGIRWLFDPWPQPGVRNRFLSGSQIPTPYFLEFSDKFLGKKFCNSLKTGSNFFLQN
jgi:hypothetical protein